MKKERMNEENRHYIAVALTEGKSISNIAKDLGKSASTISREIKNHFIIRRTGASGMPFNACSKRFGCRITSICEGCSDKKCRLCSHRCNDLCREFTPDQCALLVKPPYVPNAVPARWKSISMTRSVRRRSMRRYGLNPIPVLP